MNALHPSFADALDRLGVPDAIRALITERHSEPHRHYHTLRHIDLMLRELPHDHRFSREMAAATLFHDIIYDPTRSDNEELSRALFQTVAQALSPTAPLDAALVSAMILATKSHHFSAEHTEADAAVNILLKADLSILWHPDPQIYQWYARGVRQEYAFVPEAPFHEARSRILIGLRDDLLASGQLTFEQSEVLRRNTDSELA